eukprot:TRINITY_DN30029_c0_g1_i1.p1 TRINITY_DN30029_c0_g1~~TRINITY_DN30029_c0_g1_i1.p1  ORF type:complete len:1306 (-),score=271.85 TRINITY_DN30029_c0_g1_i1:197-4114(-)
MEINVVNSQGLEKDALVSIKVGELRKQGTLNHKSPFFFPACAPNGCAEKARIDVYRPLSGSGLTVNLRPSEDEVVVMFPTPPGRTPKTLTLQVSSPNISGKTAGESTTSWPSCVPDEADVAPAGFALSGGHPADPKVCPPLEKDIKAQGGRVAAAQAYLAKFSLLERLQDLLGQVLHEKPNDPFRFLAARMCRLIGSPGRESIDLDTLDNAPEPAQEPQPQGESPHKQPKSAHVDAPGDSQAVQNISEEMSRLKDDNSKLWNEIKRLRGHCETHGMSAHKIESTLGQFATDQKAVEPDSPTSPAGDTLAQVRKQLQAEREELRHALTELALAFAQYVGKMQAANAMAGGATAVSSAFGGARRQTNLWGTARRMSRMQNMHMGFDLLTSSDESDESGSEGEAEPEFARKRGYAVSSEAYGAWNNRRAAFVPPRHEKNEEHMAGLQKILSHCPLFRDIPDSVLTVVIGAMPVTTVRPGELIIKQHDPGDSLFVLLSGSVELFDESVEPSRMIVKFSKGRIFGELAMLYNMPRSLSIYCASGKQSCVVAELTRSVYQNLIVRHQMKDRVRREECLCQSRYLDTLSRENLAMLADALKLKSFEDGDHIVTQGEEGDEFFIVLSGECAALVEMCDGSDVQEHRRYQAGDLFGEKALLRRGPRAATVKALSAVETLSLTRRSFERLFGPLGRLRSQHYKTDPRKSLVDFYLSGDRLGCRGARLRDRSFKLASVPDEEATDWFAVYRPTSRDAIAKMLSGCAVGKGLNVKGKSAKTGPYSGYVPFLQISDNSHKRLLAPPKANGRIKIFFHTEVDRTKMLKVFEPLLETSSEAGNCLLIEGDRVIDYIDLYGDVFGLDVPEPCIYEVFITRADMSFQMGWETGRKSEPAFLDMNFASLRSGGEPPCVLLQADRQDALNPHGLLIAYAERAVKPVVSDFDTFLVGSRGMKYADLSPDQVALERWALEKTESILATPAPGSWTSRWLEVISDATTAGQYPKTIPKFGFGDPVSYNLIEQVIVATIDTGAVRHGAECFNFLFPQELDDEYLVVWDGYGDSYWQYLTEDEVREFLTERAAEGFVFPLNPVWIVRDFEWYEVYKALSATEEGKAFLAHYFPPDSGIQEKLESLHIAYPDCFLANGTNTGGASRKSLALDMDAGERMALALTNLTTVTRKAKRNKVEVAEEDSDGSSSSDGEACPCGNIFMEDANFCRKCGRERLHGSAEQATPATAAAMKIMVTKSEPAAGAVKSLTLPGQARPRRPSRLADIVSDGVGSGSRDLQCPGVLPSARAKSREGGHVDFSFRTSVVPDSE